MWKYNAGDGETLVEWSKEQHKNFVSEAKDLETFPSAVWRRDYNPFLNIFSIDENDGPLIASRFGT